MPLYGDKQTMKNLRTLARTPRDSKQDEILIEALTPLKNMTNATAPRPALRSGAVIAKRPGRGRGKTYWVAFRRGIAMRIAHLVELGTLPHSLAKGASRRYGIMQDVPPFHPGTGPEPWFRPAFESTKQQAIQIYGKLTFQAMVESIRGVKPGGK